jgi:hypothetical protein
MSLAIFCGEELSNCKLLTVYSTLWGSCHDDDGYAVQECKLAAHTLKANNRIHAQKRPQCVHYHQYLRNGMFSYITFSAYSTLFGNIYSPSSKVKPQKILMSEEGSYSLNYDTSFSFNYIGILK